MGSNGIFCFISKTPFATVTSLTGLYFRIRRFIILVQVKNSDFYELRQQHKQLQTIEMSEA